MKTIASSLFSLLLMISVSGFSQSKSFATLQDKFAHRSNVFSVNTSGFLARTILWMAGEHEFNKAIRDVRNVRLITIPKSAFHSENVSLKGFKEFIKTDSFEELTHVRDNGDDVTLYLQSKKTTKNNRYMLLIDSDQEVVAIEIRGYIDPELLFNHKNDVNLSYQYN
jgi:hypothetical protein